MKLDPITTEENGLIITTEFFDGSWGDTAVQLSPELFEKLWQQNPNQGEEGR